MAKAFCKDVQPLDPIIIDWDDAYSTRGAYRFGDADLSTPMRRRTVGFFVEERNDRVTVALMEDSHNDGGGHVDSVFSVRHGMINRIDRLKGPACCKPKEGCRA